MGRGGGLSSQIEVRIDVASFSTKNGAESGHLTGSATSITKNAGVSPAVVQEFIGFDFKAVSQNYTHIELDAMRRATDKMPDVFGDE